jgi:TPR repeat protein
MLCRESRRHKLRDRPGRGPRPGAGALALVARRRDQGDAAAQANLGNLYLDGRGVERDNGEAGACSKPPRHKAYPAARSDLGYIYAEGVGVVADHAKALDLFRQARRTAMPGDGVAGVFSRAGNGSDAERRRGAALYRAAAEAGDDCAAFALGDIYRFGRA